MALISGATIAEAIGDSANELTQLVAAQPEDARLVNELSLRVLNRPANDAERAAFADVLNQLDGDHQRLVAALKQRTEEVAARKPELEKKREDSIARTKTELGAYEKELAPRLAELEKQRQQNIEARKADITAYDGRLAARVTEWEKQQTAGVEWIPLLPSSVTGPKEATLTLENDRSVVVESKNAKKAILTVMLPTNLRNITAFRLEAIGSDKAPNGGPGGRLRSREGDQRERQ
jgi:hypothetical protein